MAPRTSPPTTRCPTPSASATPARIRLASCALVTELDADLDARSLRLGDLKIGDINIHVPPGQAVFQGDFDFSGNKGYVLRVSGGVDAQTRVATWLIQAIDPDTGEVLRNPTRGLLLPGSDGKPATGFVSYTVRALDIATTGAAIQSSARAFFDEAPARRQRQRLAHPRRSGTRDHARRHRQRQRQPRPPDLQRRLERPRRRQRRQARHRLCGRRRRRLPHLVETGAAGATNRRRPERSPIRRPGRQALRVSWPWPPTTPATAKPPTSPTPCCPTTAARPRRSMRSAAMKRWTPRPRCRWPHPGAAIPPTPSSNKPRSACPASSPPPNPAICKACSPPCRCAPSPVASMPARATSACWPWSSWPTARSWRAPGLTAMRCSAGMQTMPTAAARPRRCSRSASRCSTWPSMRLVNCG